jgi:vanillate O-demethylase ferredoxin subunit
MAKRLAGLGKPFALHVCARNEASLPFREALASAPLSGHVALHFDRADGTSSLDPAQAFAKPSPGALLYLCGPAGFMDWLRGAAIAAGWDQAQIRIENFAAPVLEDGEQRPFQVELTRSHRSVSVRSDESIIDALARIGIDVPFACMQGTCGTCIAPVSGGAVDHRDAFLSREEKAAGDRMCLCVSRARDASIAIDL